MNFKCPHCARPHACGCIRNDFKLFGNPLRQMTNTRKCSCGTIFTYITVVGKSKFEYESVLFKDIIIPIENIKKIKHITFGDTRNNGNY